MNNDNKIIPQYRFPEFKDDGSWQISPLSDKIDYERPDKYIVKNTNYINKGTPVLTANKSFVLGYTDENEGIYKDNLPVIIFDDFTVDNKYVDFPFKVKSSAIKILKNKNEDDSLKFFYELISQIKFEAKEHKRYYISAFQKIEIPVPTNPVEQQKIAACLSSLDDVIAGHEEKLTALEEHKNGLMQNLFPQDGETLPKYRFPAFVNDGDWNVVPFSKYITLFRGSSPRPIVDFQTTDEDAVNWIKIGDTKNSIGYKLQYAEEKITHEGAKRSRPVVKGEIILANSMSYGKAYILELNGCIYDGWFVLRNYEEFFDKNYLIQLLNSDYLQDQYKKLAAGGIVQNISSEIVYNTELFHTTKDEQQKIASVLSSMDELIVAQREKIEALKEHKKGVMQGLFPKIKS